MCNAACAKIFLIVFNVIFWLAGCGVLGIGIWMKVDPTIVNYLNVANIHQSDPLISHAALLFIVVGGFMFIVGLLGCCGAIRGSQLLLFLYAALVIVVMLAEIAAAVLTLIYKSKVEDHLEESMQKQINEEYRADSMMDSWDFLQVKLKCCGGSGPGDYMDSYWYNSTRTNTTDVVPATCCVLSSGNHENPHVKDNAQCQRDAAVENIMESEYVYVKGCHQSILDWFKMQSLILMIIGFAVGGIQVFGIIAACWLRAALKREKPTV